MAERGSRTDPGCSRARFGTPGAIAEGSKVNYVGSGREDVYPGRPDPQMMTREVEGWCLATIISNAVKQTIRKRVYEVAGLHYGIALAPIVAGRCHVRPGMDQSASRSRRAEVGNDRDSQDHFAS